MFLWHFPSGRPARVLPGTLPGGARTFLPSAHGEAAATRPPGSTSSLAGRIERRQSGGQLRGQPLRRLAVERLVSEPVGDAILLARHVLHSEAPEPAAQLQQPLVERPQLGVAHPVAPL